MLRFAGDSRVRRLQRGRVDPREAPALDPESTPTLPWQRGQDLEGTLSEEGEAVSRSEDAARLAGPFKRAQGARWVICAPCRAAIPPRLQPHPRLAGALCAR